MARLSTRARVRLKSRNPRAFALKGGGKRGRFPITDRRHAANALSRASQGVKRGTLSSSEAAQVRRKACGQYRDLPSCRKRNRGR